MFERSIFPDFSSFFFWWFDREILYDDKKYRKIFSKFLWISSMLIIGIIEDIKNIVTAYSCNDNKL